MARFRVDDVWALFAGRRVAVAGEILEGEVRPGMVARAVGGFTAVVQAVEFVRQSGGVEQVSLDLGSPDGPAEQQAWMAALSALSELTLDDPEAGHPEAAT
ncbi:hypothetical protein [Roseisolibacter sp. H3M3-2]|uniref:hypothetical protein n=1 Tax=Roseisolibacter sp. H3M3-2 TaxID=3031323 RepID=UPI0023DAC50C|nr:hypothetical protein [Roseisolibacter sp. H3M3-2]MDF1501795.1 hypothetical protein [Roseisolibacter sp. H3M3-2]